jgi:hypothetical protein
MKTYLEEETRLSGLQVLVKLVTAPFVGLFYFLSLPFIAIGMILMVAGGKIYGLLKIAASNAVSFGWRPMEAYLIGRKRVRKNKVNNK